MNGECCLNCSNARQVADKSRQDICGCIVETETMEHFPIQYYQGWYYAKRRVGDIDDSDKTIGRGALVNSNITEVTHHCKFYSEL